jgi:uncharacterized protein YdeI (YjbR/CyaY-like superfamily)
VHIRMLDSVPPMSRTRKAKPKPPAPPKHFEARLERLRSRLNWIIVYVPFDASEAWGLRGQIKVKGQINGFALRTSLFPTREGRHFLLVNKRMQKEARAFEGSIARFQLALDTEQRSARIPAELDQILRQSRHLQRWYGELNHSTRSEIAKWITEPKSSETRVRRAEQMAERLLSVMDAERELPPVLRVAFGRNQLAREGWDKMSVARRRGHLFGIFYYRTPEAQQRRIDKMLDDAAAVAAKTNERKKRPI